LDNRKRKPLVRQRVEENGIILIADLQITMKSRDYNSLPGKEDVYL